MTVTREVLSAIFQKLDANNDNLLDESEFREGYERLRPEADAAAFAAKWRAISGGKPKVTLEELAAYWGIKLGTDELETAGMTDDQVLEIMALRGLVTTMEEEKKRKAEEEAAMASAEAILARTSIGGRTSISGRTSRRGSRGDQGVQQRQQTRRESKVVQIRKSSNVIASEDRAEVSFLQAADVGDFDVVEKYLAGANNVNVCDDRQETALHKLCRMPPSDGTRWRELFDALLKAGIEVDYMDKRGKTALFTAAEYGRPDICNWLIMHGADINWLSNEWETVLHQALASNKEEVVKLLLSEKHLHRISDLNAVDSAGRTPLHIASFKAATDIVQLLLEAKADPLVEDNNKNSAAKLAERTGRKDSAALLRTHQDAAAKAAASHLAKQG